MSQSIVRRTFPAGLDNNIADVDIAETAICFCSEFDGIAVTGDDAVADTDVFAETWRGGFKGNAVIVGICHHSGDGYLVASVQIKGIVVIVVAVEYFDTVDSEAVASQIVLHPTTAVLQGNVLDGNIVTLDEAE